MSRLIVRLAVLTSLLFAAAMFVPAIRAVAGGYGSVDCKKNPSDPHCVITVWTLDAPGGNGATTTSSCHNPLGHVVPCFLDGAGWLASDGCYYRPAVGAELTAAQDAGGVPTPPAAWYIGVCGYPPVQGLTKFRAFGSPPGPQLLADEAVRALRLPTPVIRVSPAPPVPQIVYLPTWVWLGAESWAPRSATASVPGMAVTATAIPATLALLTGDGGSVTCVGAGTAWTPGGDATAASPSCGHTYSHPGSYPLRATVTWNVSWAGGGVTGAAAGMTTTATLPVRVVEEQVLNGGQGG